MTKVHCSNCDGDFPINDFNVEYHGNGYCKSLPEEKYKKLPFREKFDVELFCIAICCSVMVVAFGSSLVLNDGSMKPATICVDSHISLIEEFNANNKATYREPTKICDVIYYTDWDSYKYSYYMQKKYDKPWYSIYTDCQHAVWNNTTKNFICPNGKTANELRMRF